MGVHEPEVGFPLAIYRRPRDMYSLEAQYVCFKVRSFENLQEPTVLAERGNTNCKLYKIRPLSYPELTLTFSLMRGGHAGVLLQEQTWSTFLALGQAGNRLATKIYGGSQSRSI